MSFSAFMMLEDAAGRGFGGGWARSREEGSLVVDFFGTGEAGDWRCVLIGSGRGARRFWGGCMGRRAWHRW